MKKVAGQEERLEREEEEEVKKYNQEEKELSLPGTDCELFLSLNIHFWQIHLSCHLMSKSFFFVQIYEVISFSIQYLPHKMNKNSTHKEQV